MVELKRLPFAPLRLSTPGVKSMGPASMRVNTRLCLMFGRIRRIAPGVVFHATRAFARYPVGVRAPQPGVLDRLVRVDGDAALRGFLDHVKMMARLHLSVVPLEVNAPVRAQGLHAAGVGHVTGLDRVDPEFRVEVERCA